MQKQVIEFVRAEEPIEKPVTKFGGAPVWVAAPQWPLSRETGLLMQFVAQVAIDPALFGGEPGRVAYLFMSAGEDSYSTWEPRGGENALIIQPSAAVPCVETAALNEGPSLFEMVPAPQGKSLVESPCEFAVRLSDPVEGQGPESEQCGFDNQIGGAPCWLQSEELPTEEWRLLLQLDSASVPFWINFGDVGVGYAFLSPDGDSGLFLWQCA